MKKWSVQIFFILLLGLLAMGGCQKNTAPENMTPDQQEITTVLKTWQNAWNKQNVGMMTSIYDTASEEYQWIKSNLRTRNSRVTVSVKEIAVFGNDALARVKVYGQWNSKDVFALEKINGQWKIQARSYTK